MRRKTKKRKVGWDMAKPNEPKEPKESRLRKTIIKSFYVVLLFAIVGASARIFVSFFEAVVLIPLKTVFHIPQTTD